MRSTPLAALLLLAACAPANTTLSETQRRTVTSVETGEGATYTITQTVEDGVRTAILPATPDAAWDALPGVFASLGVPVTAIDTRAKLLGTTENRVRRVGDERPGRYLDCGAGLNGQYANVYDVYLTVLTQLVPAAAGGTEVRTRVVAQARDGAHGNNPVRCSTKGTLETRILEALQASLGSPGA